MSDAENSDAETINAVEGYAGDITGPQAWNILSNDPTSILVDVRTDAEWRYVGRADLSQLDREPLYVSWQLFETRDLNPDFVAEMNSALGTSDADAETPIMFLCRSGVRSQSAAIAMTGQGFRRCYNIAGGFEGDLDENQHRGINGWKVDSLPWVQ